jgi:hypothetical protein
MTNSETGRPVDLVMPELLEGVGGFGELGELDEHSDPAELARIVQRLATQLDRCAEYGQRLWQQLRVVETYLRDDVARADLSGATRVLAGENAHRRWAEIYGSTLSMLAGARGDSGYGQQQAQLELQNVDSRAAHGGAAV